MADQDDTIQLVTFQLGRETYGIDIMGVKATMTRTMMTVIAAKASHDSCVPLAP